MDSLKVFLDCLTCNSSRGQRLQLTSSCEKPLLTQNYNITNEKMSFQSSHPIKQTDQEIAAKIIEILRTAQKSGPRLSVSVQDIAVQAGGWTERLAKALRKALEEVLKAADHMGDAMKEAHEKSMESAMKIEAFIEDSEREHPIYTALLITVVALGILVLLTPWVIEALGFAATGPVEGGLHSNRDT